VLGREAAHEAIKEAAVGTALDMRKGQAENDLVLLDKVRRVDIVPPMPARVMTRPAPSDTRSTPCMRAARSMHS